MSIDSKDSLVWLKSMARAQSLPLDSTEVFSSVEEAQTYASTSAVAYAGQTVKALGSDGEYSTYILQPSEGDGYSLEELSVEESSQPVVESKQQIKVVTSLPTSNQAEGVLYIVGSEGYTWTGSDWNKVFYDPTSQINAAVEKTITIENGLDYKISSSKSTAVTEATAAANTARETRIGEIPANTTVKAYIDEVLASSGGGSSEDTEALKGIIDRTIVNFKFPENVDSIGTSAFANCSKLAITSLPQSVTIIGGYAFQNCYKLALTSLPSGVTYIGKSTFQNCSSLTTITFTNDAQNPGITIESNAFQNCNNLTTINVPWAEGAVANAPWGATNATINYNYVAS